MGTDRLAPPGACHENVLYFWDSEEILPQMAMLPGCCEVSFCLKKLGRVSPMMFALHQQPPGNGQFHGPVPGARLTESRPAEARYPS